MKVIAQKEPERNRKQHVEQHLIYRGRRERRHPCRRVRRHVRASRYLADEGERHKLRMGGIGHIHVLRGQRKNDQEISRHQIEHEQVHDERAPPGHAAEPAVLHHQIRQRDERRGKRERDAGYRDIIQIDVREHGRIQKRRSIGRNGTCAKAETPHPRMTQAYSFVALPSTALSAVTGVPSAST